MKNEKISFPGPRGQHGNENFYSDRMAHKHTNSIALISLSKIPLRVA